MLSVLSVSGWHDTSTTPCTTALMRRIPPIETVCTTVARNRDAEQTYSQDWRRRNCFTPTTVLKAAGTPRVLTDVTQEHGARLPVPAVTVTAQTVPGTPPCGKMSS